MFSHNVFVKPLQNGIKMLPFLYMFEFLRRAWGSKSLKVFHFEKKLKNDAVVTEHSKQEHTKQEYKAAYKVLRMI